MDGDELSLLSVTELTKLYSGDCYIVQYTFLGNGRDETLFYAWLGSKCVTVSTNQGFLSLLSSFVTCNSYKWIKLLFKITTTKTKPFPTR